jgi:hypothetical protein
MKPILKIEMPNLFAEEFRKEVEEVLEKSSVAKEYHILVFYRDLEYIHVEIITAGDINLHLPPVSK